MGKCVTIVTIGPDVDRALELLRLQGYFCQVDVDTPLSDLDACERLVDMVRVRGWCGDLDRRVTRCGELGQFASYFDPVRLTADLVDELVKDEVTSRWLRSLTEKGPR